MRLWHVIFEIKNFLSKLLKMATENAKTCRCFLFIKDKWNVVDQVCNSEKGVWWMKVCRLYHLFMLSYCVGVKRVIYLVVFIWLDQIC